MPASVPPSARLDLSTVSTIVHRLQTAFQEALDLYNVVSQAQGQGRGLGGEGAGLPGLRNR